MINLNDGQKKILVFTQALQKQITVPLWSLADEHVIQSVSRNKKVIFGKSGEKLYLCALIAKKLNLVNLLLCIAGCAKAFSIWIKIRVNPPSSEIFEKVFAGFGAASEEHYYENFKRNTKQPFLRINVCDYTNMFKLSCPTLSRTFSEVCRNVFGYYKKIENAIPEIRLHQEAFLTVCAKNIGIYSFFCVYWREAKLRGVNEATYLAPDVSCFACVQSGIKTIFLQHGLFNFGILMPEIHHINAITTIEVKYFQAIFPKKEIIRMQHNIVHNKNYSNTVMILSLNIFFEERVKEVVSFISWANRFHLKVVIRPTNTVTQNELLLLHNQFPGSVIDEITSSIYNSIERYQPKLVAAWTSTALAIALESGVVPISFYNPDADLWNLMVYPLREILLFWPRDWLVIEKIIRSPIAYCMHLQRIRSVGGEKKNELAVC